MFPIVLVPLAFGPGGGGQVVPLYTVITCRPTRSVKPSPWELEMGIREFAGHWIHSKAVFVLLVLVAKAHAAPQPATPATDAWLKNLSETYGGMDYQFESHYLKSRAVDELNKLCDAGDIDACVLNGHFSKSCELGDEGACEFGAFIAEFVQEESRQGVNARSAPPAGKDEGTSYTISEMRAPPGRERLTGMVRAQSLLVEGATVWARPVLLHETDGRVYPWGEYGRTSTRFTGRAPHLDWRSTTTDTHGVFSFSSVPSGVEWEVEVEHALGHREMRTQQAITPVEVDLHPKSQTEVAIAVVDTKGRPVSGARVSGRWHEQRRGIYTKWFPQDHAVFGENRRGSQRIYVYHPKGSGSIALSPEGTTVEIIPEQRTRLLLLDAEGAVVPNAMVEIYESPLVYPLTLPRRNMSVISDDQGRLPWWFGPTAGSDERPFQGEIRVSVQVPDTTCDLAIWRLGEQDVPEIRLLTDTRCDGWGDDVLRIGDSVLWKLDSGSEYMVSSASGDWKSRKASMRSLSFVDENQRPMAYLGFKYAYHGPDGSSEDLTFKTDADGLAWVPEVPEPNSTESLHLVERALRLRMDSEQAGIRPESEQVVEAGPRWIYATPTGWDRGTGGIYCRIATCAPNPIRFEWPPQPGTRLPVDGEWRPYSKIVERTQLAAERLQPLVDRQESVSWAEVFAVLGERDLAGMALSRHVGLGDARDVTADELSGIQEQLANTPHAYYNTGQKSEFNRRKKSDGTTAQGKFWTMGNLTVDSFGGVWIPTNHPNVFYRMRPPSFLGGAGHWSEFFIEVVDGP